MMKHYRFMRIESIAVALFLFLIIFANMPGADDFERNYGPASPLQTQMDSAVSLLTEVVCNGEQLSNRAQSVLARIHRGSDSCKTLRMIDVAVIIAILLLFVQLRILWESEKGATRSQQFIIQYIHNKDGQKA